MTTDAVIDEMIRTRAVRAQPSDEAFDRLLRVSVRRTARATRKRWLLAPATIAAVLVGGVGLTGGLPAVADTIHHFVAETGIFGDGQGPGGSASGKHYTEQDNSEWIKLNSPDFVTYAVRLMPAYVELPTGTDRTRFASNVAHILHDGLPADRDSVMQATSVKGAFEVGARCLWYADWKQAAASGDHARASADGQHFLTAATWPLTVATDGGGVVANLTAIHDAAAAGDWTRAETLQGTDCDSDYMKQLTR